MAVIEQCFVLFLSVSFSFLMISMAEVKENKSVPKRFRDKPDGVKDNNPTYIPKYISPNGMLLDAIEGTTPALCTPGMTCGFQQYEQDIIEYHYYPFFSYCHCPEDYECVEGGQNMKGRFFYYTCQQVRHPEEDSVEVATAAISDSSNGASHNISADQNASGTTIGNMSPEMQNRIGLFSGTHEL